MRHFIKVIIQHLNSSSYKGTYGKVIYHKDSRLNMIGDFSTYVSKGNNYEKYRKKSDIPYGRKPHFEDSEGMRIWYSSNGKMHSSYEKYIISEM